MTRYYRLVVVAVAVGVLALLSGASKASATTPGWSDYAGVFYQATTTPGLNTGDHYGEVPSGTVIYPPPDSTHIVFYFVNGGTTQLFAPSYYALCSGSAGLCPGGQDTPYTCDVTYCSIDVYDMGPFDAATGLPTTTSSSQFSPLAAPPSIAAMTTSGSSPSTTAVDPTSAITTSTSNLLTELLAAAGIALAVAVVVFALRKGWRYLRGLTA